jgi:peptide/nickel transport system permease protein
MQLGTYIIRRLLLLIPVLIGVSIFVFALTRVTGDPIGQYVTPHMSPADKEILRHTFGFDQPVFIQYFAWLKELLLNGNLGYSKVAELPVSEAIAKFFPATFELTLWSMIFSIIFGISLGTLSAIKKDTAIDHVTRIVSLAAVSIPVFWLGLLLLFVFYSKLGWAPVPSGRLDENLFPISGIHLYSRIYLVDTLLNGRLDYFWDAFKHLILPSITLAFATVALIVRMMRASMLEVLGSEYVRTARMKGASEKTVIRKHARRNALIPTTTVIGLSFGGLLTGAVLTESIFSWPGLGRWAASALLANDQAAIVGFTLFTALIYVLANLIVDILYSYLDPRVRLG